MQITYTLSEIAAAAGEFWKEAKNHTVITFTGDLGAGKTTFIAQLCKELGVRQVPSSPTFALINEYTFSDNGRLKKIYHTDWYRLRNEEEAIQAGIEDMLLQEDAYCLVEWPERAPELIPKDALHVYIEIIDPETRALKTQKK